MAVHLFVVQGPEGSAIGNLSDTHLHVRCLEILGQYILPGNDS